MPLIQYLFRFLDSLGNPRDLQITPGSDEGYRLSTLEKGELSYDFAEVLALPVNVYSIVYQKTMTEPTYVPEIFLSGKTDCKFTVSIDGNVVARKNLDIFTKDFNLTFYKPLFLDVGQVLAVFVINNGTQTSDFETTVYTVH